MTAIVGKFDTSGTALTVTTGDTLILAVNDCLISTVADALALFGLDQNYDVTVNGLLNGSMAGSYSGIYLANSSSSAVINISQSGIVRGDFAIGFNGALDITNHGSIFGTTVGFYHNSSHFALINDGSITGDFQAIFISASASGTSTITNTGLLTGGVQAILSASTTSAETITNTGVIRGDIVLNGGDDRVENNGGNGVIYGTTNLGAGTDAYFGGVFADVVNGGDDTDFIFGYAGADTLNGEDGTDQLDGGMGKDTLTGGLSFDQFLFSTVNPSADFDTITDFSHVDDVIYFEDAAFKGLGPVDTYLKQGAFKNLALGKVDLSDRIIFDSAKDDLYYDRDGSGTAFARVKIAHFDNDPTILANDIYIF